ncbi:MAG TPA: NADH:ubiquinone oxidoreductase subunit NDUFA12 [Methylocystis sp.]|nr:NADH:ubiquinone oxidoreductase subunit NDUFA12 [Methylocystis sp.]
MGYLNRLFTWWNQATLSTGLHTLLHGERVGQDEFGNVYYRRRGGKIDKALGFERRWVIYKGLAEGSATPPGWYGWLHHTVDTPPTQENYEPKPWQLAYQENKTGTAQAYRPPGSLLATGRRAPSDGDYGAWSPEG